VVDNAHPVPDTAGNKKPLRWLAPEGQKSWKRLSPSRRAGKRGDDCDDGYDDDGCGRGAEASEGSRGTAERHEEPWKKAPVESPVQPEFQAVGSASWAGAVKSVAHGSLRSTTTSIGRLPWPGKTALVDT
jgi:hypothetical protein